MAHWCRKSMLGLMVLWSVLPMSEVWAEAIGQVKAVSGDVVLLRGDTRMSAKVEDLVEQADAVTTGADGRVGITFIDNSRFSVGPNSRVAFEEFVFNSTTREGTSRTKIERGAMGVISGHIARSAPDAMKVQTPTTILGVRGTNFLVQVKD